MGLFKTLYRRHFSIKEHQRKTAVSVPPDRSVEVLALCEIELARQGEKRKVEKVAKQAVAAAAVAASIQRVIATSSAASEQSVGGASFAGTSRISSSFFDLLSVTLFAR